MTHRHKHTLHTKKKVGVYASTKHTNIPFCEQIAIIFDMIHKKVILSEELYAQKEFEKAYHIVKDNINIATSLCDLLMSTMIENKAEKDANKWQKYFTDLMHAFVLLSSNHNEERKQKILESLKTMSSLWRKRGEKLQEQTSVTNAIEESMSTNKKTSSLDANVFLDA